MIQLIRLARVSIRLFLRRWCLFWWVL